MIDVDRFFWSQYAAYAKEIARALNEHVPPGKPTPTMRVLELLRRQIEGARRRRTTLASTG